MSGGNHSFAAASSQGDVESPAGMPRMCEMNESDSRLSAALRHLGAIAPRGAPAALGDMLKDEFRRQHARRRRERNARILLIAACFAWFAIVPFFIWPDAPNKTATHEPVQI